MQDIGIRVYFLENKNDCREINDWCPDIVHIHSHGVNVCEFYSIYSLCPAAKFVETNVFSRPSPWVNEIDISFQLSQWCNWLYRTRFKAKHSSIILPNPVETSAFSFVGGDRVKTFRDSHGIKPHDLIIGRVGQSFDGKWSPMIIDIFNSLRRSVSNLKLIVVNPPDSIVRKARLSHFSEDIIHIKQILSDSHLADCYSAIDIFVLIAEQGESFGMVLAESLLCQTPVVTLSTPWGDNSQGEVVGNGVGGYVAAEKKDVLRLIKRLMDDSRLRKAMGLAGRNRIIELFNSKNVAADALKSLEKGSDYDKVCSPLSLMRDSEGKLSIATKLILSSERAFPFLLFSTGYKPLHHLPFFLVKALVRSLRKLL